MKKTKLLIVHHRHQHYSEYLREREPSLEIISFDSRDTIPFESHEAEILICWHLPEELLRRLPRLRWIASAAAGVDHLLNILPSGSDIVITKALATMGQFLAQYVLTFILHRLRGVGTIIRQQDEKRWRYVRSDLIQRYTLGILGLGNIGSQIADTAKRLGMKVLGAKKTPMEDPPCDRLFFGDGWREMLPPCDFLVLTLPLTPETEGMISADELELMKPGAVLINVSRGKIVNEAALIQALERGIIAGAVLDVFREEPLPSDHPFWEMENVVVTPHCAGPSEEGPICEEFLENYHRWLRGKPLKLAVDPEKGY